MTKDQAIQLLFSKIEAGRALNMAKSFILWDATTTGVPVRSLPARGAASGWISGEIFRRFVAPDTLEAIETLEAIGGGLSEYESAMVRVLGREYRKLRAVPPDEFQAFKALITQSEPVWEAARAKRDFDIMVPYYDKIFEYQRRLCDWYGYEEHPYDALLDDFEQGASVKMLDSFFSALRDRIVPLLKDIISAGKQPREITGMFDIGKQRELMPWLCDFVGYDRSRGKVAEVEHPFCSTFSRHDVRITTKYHEDNLLAAVYSTIHEAGHALYEQNMEEDMEPYRLAHAASMGLHESQSRLFENMICRSRGFTALLLDKLQEKFGDYFSSWDEDMLFRAVNIVRPSLIRIEADELTYCLHIIVRYELEKGLMSGETRASMLPGLWAEKYEELIGVRPGNLAEGVLQDVHWNRGLVGYFPSYAVGTAYGAQLVHAMKKTVDVDAAVKKGDLSPVAGWMKEKVHRHGARLLPGDLIKHATGEAFDPSYYVDYLSEKFTELYL